MQRVLSARVGFGLVAALYLLSLPYHPGLRSPNELCRLWQSRSLVDFGTLNINGTLRQLGMVGDLSCTRVVDEGGGAVTLHPCVGPNAPQQNVIDQLYYPSKAPLISFLGAPVYWVLERVHGQVGEVEQVAWTRLLVLILPTLGLLVLLRRFLSAFLSAELTDFLVVVYALGSMAFSYSQAVLSHQLTATLLFAAFFVAWRIERKEWSDRAYVLAGFLSGAVVVAEYTGALGVVCISSFVIASRWKQWPALGRAVLLVLVGAAPLLVGLMLYHRACFGSPLTSGYKFLNDAAYQGWHVGGFLGIRLPDARAFFLSIFSPLRGLLVLSPFLAAALFGLGEARARAQPYFVLLVVLLAGNAYFTSSFTYDSWGWTVGPRHLTPMLPFLMLPVGLALQKLQGSSPLRFAFFAGLCVSAVLMTGFVTFVNYVPDDVSTAFWALSLPMLQEGAWPISWLAAVIPNPASGAVLVVLVLAATGWAAGRFFKLGALPLVGLAAVLLHFGVLRAFTRYDDHDVNAKQFLERVWVVPSGQTLRFR
jgi:hypothetical protein